MSNYWIERMEAEMKARQELDSTIGEEMKRLHDYYMRQIETEIQAFYQRYAMRNEMSVSDVKKLVEKMDVEAFSDKAKRYVAEKNFSPQANAELGIYNLKMRVSRLELLQYHLDLEMVALANEEHQLTEKFLDEAFTDELRVQAGILGEVVARPKMIEHMAETIKNTPYKGATWSKRIWERQQALRVIVAHMAEEALLKGKSPLTMIPQLRREFDVSRYEAKRLAVTEVARVQTAAQKETYLANGFEYYEYVAEPKACVICAKLADGKPLPVKEMKPGINAAPMHPHCHCSTVPVVAERNKIELSQETDYMKASRMITPEKGECELLNGEGVSFSARKVLNSKHDLYVSDSLGSGRKSFNFYERQIDDVLPKLNLPESAEKPRFVLADFAKDVGKKHGFGSYDPKTNTVFLDASKPNQKGIERKLKIANEKWLKSGKTSKFFAVDDDPRSPLVHEMGHKKHYDHVLSYAKKNGITYAESKERFNEKLLEFIEQKGYNLENDISGYARKHFNGAEQSLSRTNEIISEAMTLLLLKNDAKAKQIIKFLEKEDW